MNAMSVEIVLDFMSFPAEDVWGQLRLSHSNLLVGTGTCQLSGNECPLDAVQTRIKKTRNSHFSIVVNGIEFHYSHVRNFDHSLLWARYAAHDSDDAWAWVKPFASTPVFRQAWVYNDAYNYWQNAQDPLEYKAEGRSTAGLPMKSNGLPPPLDQMVVDVSSNPGRRVIRRGYIEAVAHLMWLGETFWTLTGAAKEQVCGNRLVESEVVLRNVVQLRCSQHPFTTANGPDGALQQELRALLYTPSLRR